MCLPLRACLTLKIIPSAPCLLWHTALPSAADFDKYHICSKTEETRSRRVDPYTCWLCLSLVHYRAVVFICNPDITDAASPFMFSPSLFCSKAKVFMNIKLFTNQHSEERAGSHLQTLAERIYFGLGVYVSGLKEMRDGCIWVICMSVWLSLRYVEHFWACVCGDGAHASGLRE